MFPLAACRPKGLVAPGFDAASLLIFAAFTTPPSAARKTLINACVVALKAGGVWSKLDLLYILAAADSQAAAINWKSPGTFVASAVNSPTFTADRGYAGNGSSSRLDTGWDPTANGVNFVRDECSVWAWSPLSIQDDAASVGNITGLRVRMVLRDTVGDRVRGSLSDGSTDSSTGSTAGGLRGLQRRGATDKRAWINGAQVLTAATASTGLSNVSQWICGANSTEFSTQQIAAAAWGASLTGLESSFYNALLAYMQGVGAA